MLEEEAAGCSRQTAVPVEAPRALGSGPGALHPGRPLGLFISVWPALLQAIEIHWPALATVTKINSRGSLDHSWLSSGGGPEGDMSAPQGGLLEVRGGRERLLYSTEMSPAICHV